MLRRISCFLIVLFDITYQTECRAGNTTQSGALSNALYDTYELFNCENRLLGDEVNWGKLVENANQEVLSEWKHSDSALESDLKRNLKKWNELNKMPFMIRNDSIFYQIYYSEQIFDMMIGLDNLKERIGEVLSFTKLHTAVKSLFLTMAQKQKELYVSIISNKDQRTKTIPYRADEYKLFGAMQSDD